MVTRPDMLDSDPKNPELLDVQNDLDFLQSTVKENLDSYTTQAPYEKNWAVILQIKLIGLSLCINSAEKLRLFA